MAAKKKVLPSPFYDFLLPVTRRHFEIPVFYRSPVISLLKRARRAQDRYRKDLTPTVLELEGLRFKIARHFGFCYGVEHAIEKAYRAIDENEGKRIFLLSEMIHNPHVNEDLKQRGVQFLMKTDGTPLIPLTDLKPEDVVIIPAFGTTVEMFDLLQSRGIDTQTYDTTCPFVEKVWNRSSQLGEKGYTVIIHGRFKHEETRATFSHALLNAPGMVIQDMEEAAVLAEYICNERPIDRFFQDFPDRCSPGFRPEADLTRIGVVNQTTMLATETHAISEFLKSAIIRRFGDANLSDHFADTRDTLCYATSENQTALKEMLTDEGDLALIVGGYNSSNTSHLVELCEERMPTYYIKDEFELISRDEIRHLDLKSGQAKISSSWMPANGSVTILLSAGASCPDALVDRVLNRTAALFGITPEQIEKALQPYAEMAEADL